MIPLVFESPEWVAAWEWLAAHPINAGQSDPVCSRDAETGEVWQYMGPCADGHQFRHRHHPGQGRRVVLTYLEDPRMRELSARFSALVVCPEWSDRGASVGNPRIGFGYDKHTDAEAFAASLNDAPHHPEFNAEVYCSSHAAIDPGGE